MDDEVDGEEDGEEDGEVDGEEDGEVDIEVDREVDGEVSGNGDGEGDRVCSGSGEIGRDGVSDPDTTGWCWDVEKSLFVSVVVTAVVSRRLLGVKVVLVVVLELCPFL